MKNINIKKLYIYYYLFNIIEYIYFKLDHNFNIKYILKLDMLS